MSKYILLLNWTEQGIKAIKDSGARYDAAKARALEMGVTLETVYMTYGMYDQVIVADCASDEAMAIFLLKSASMGYFRCITLKGFTEAEYKKITAATA